MKKALLFIAVIAVIAGCTKKEVNNESPIDIFNGYGHLKGSEPTATLWAGKNTDVGTVTYGIEQIDGVGYFTATYDLTGGWEMSESHLYAGPLGDMPLNKPGNPKIGRFPYAEDHSPNVTTYTYYVDCDELPPYEDPGFTTAAHAVVHGPNGQEETAWRDGDHNFPGKRWGWYDDFYYDNAGNPITVLYGTEYANDGYLNVYLLDVTNGNITHLLNELVGSQGTEFDGTAFDEENGYFYFVDYNTSELYFIDLYGDSDVVSIGTLNGVASNATYYDGSYYYVDASTNELIEVQLGVSDDGSLYIISETVISTVPFSVNVNDIAFDLSGNTMYIIGNYNGTVQLIEYDLESDTYSSLDIDVPTNAQIAFGSDGSLYVVSSGSNGEVIIEIIDPDSGSSTLISGNANDTDTDNGTDEVNPFADLASGPMM